MPYALFGTCLGAITAYELARCAIAAGKPAPVKLYMAAVSPPHIYAGAVAKLYLAEGDTSHGPEMMAGVLEKLRNWEQLPRELIMQVRHALLMLLFLYFLEQSHGPKRCTENDASARSILQAWSLPGLSILQMADFGLSCPFPDDQENGCSICATMLVGSTPASCQQSLHRHQPVLIHGWQSR